MRAPSQAPAPLLAGLARARLRDPARVDGPALELLRDELWRSLREVAARGEAVDDVVGLGDAGAAEAARRVASATGLLPSLAAEVLDPARLRAGRYAGEWEAVGGRLRTLLRPPVAAVLPLVELLAESPAFQGQDAATAPLAAVRDAVRAALELVRDAVQLLELLGGQVPPEQVSPAVRVAVEGARGTTGGPAPVAAGTVLVVDDSSVNRDLLERLVTRLGLRVRQAEGGPQALALMRGELPDLVLLDIIMPEVDGFQTLRQLKADPALRGVPVIVVSALDDLESVGRCLELGAEDYLTKPIDPAILRARIGATLEKRRLRALVGDEVGVGRE